MTQRITSIVNEVIRGECGAEPLTETKVLELIDTGSSEGGSQVAPSACVMMVPACALG